MSSKKFIVTALSILIYLLITWAFTEYAYPPDQSGVRTTTIGFLLVAVAAVLGNIRIIHYHATNPPHPKFLLMTERKFWVRVHAITGSFEVVLGIIAWFTMDKNLAMAVGLIAILGHVPSAYFQAPSVFGTKGIMAPCYYAIITIHLYCAARLVMEQGDVVWLERTWMALQAYAFVRIYGTIIVKAGVFKNSVYTTSVVLAGATILPFIYGPAGPFLVLVFVGVFLGLYKMILGSEGDWDNLFEEKERGSLMDNEMRNLWIARHLNTGIMGSTAENARLVFNHLDQNKSGKLTLDEVKGLLSDWGASGEFKETFFHRYGDQQGIDFHTFLSTIWISGRMQEQLTDAAAVSITEPEHQARFIFNHLDLDSSGNLELAEIELLLMEWGMNSTEVTRYLKKFGGSDGKIDFEEFYMSMKPVWRFGFSEVYK